MHFNPFTGVLKQLIEATKAGASVKALCEKGDKLLLNETGNVSISPYATHFYFHSYASMVSFDYGVCIRKTCADDRTDEGSKHGTFSPYD